MNMCHRSMADHKFVVPLSNIILLVKLPDKVCTCCNS